MSPFTPGSDRHTDAAASPSPRVTMEHRWTTVDHRFTLKARCPADGTEDLYDCTVRVNRVLPVEQILSSANLLTADPIYQEDLTAQLANDLDAHVTTIGVHSGVTTTCECDRP